MGIVLHKLFSVCLRPTYIPSPLRSPPWHFPQGFVTLKKELIEEDNIVKSKVIPLYKEKLMREKGL